MQITNENVLHLHNINRFHPGLSNAISSHLLEACVITLYRQKHKKGVKIEVFGDSNANFVLDWSMEVSEQVDRAWKDQIYATEHAAACIAILLAQHLTGYSVIERSVRKTGFDYWIGSSDGILFQKKARLEVSGIFSGNKSNVVHRFKIKSEQTRQSDYLGFDAFISITEFDNLISNFARKQ